VIPLRVGVKCFMSYKEPMEFRFDGEPLWVLCGPNGAGKSAVFDARTYALFGKYRASDRRGNSPEELIHKGETSFRVEFDFEYDRRRYRIWRTRALRGGPTQGVAELTDPAAADGGPVPLRDVNLVDDLKTWV
jgi:exonuclease SbcC